MAAFLANVGANAAHPARSPLNPDGSFTLLPIPESEPWAPPMLRGRDLAHLPLPSVWQDRALHLDPDLNGDPPTYGDNCRHAGRAFSLRRAVSGDLIVFLARLHTAGGPAFHLVGRLEVAEIIRDVTADPGAGWWDSNAHVRRGRATGRWDSFWVFRGSVRSGPVRSAIRLGRDQIANLLDVTWRTNRTELQTIASHTRSVRRLTGGAEAQLRSMVV